MSTKISKADLAAKIAETTGTTKAAAAANIEAVLTAITSEVAAGNTVTLAGFGIFAPKQRAEGTARNPRTGETVKVPATTVLKFSVAKALKDAVAGA